MNIIDAARQGQLVPAISFVAEKEGLPPDFIIEGLMNGTIVIPANINHTNLTPCGIGKGLHTKVNANIGTSSAFHDIETELEKLRIALEFKADTIMDLSTGGDISSARRAILGACPVPLGTVPIYQAGTIAIAQTGSIVGMTVDGIFSPIEQQARDGVDFMTVHCGITRAAIDRLKQQKRVADVVSRGGSFLIGWMLHHDRENPLYEEYDRLLEIARAYEVTLSLGDGMRPGSISDSTDRSQIEELLTLGELVERAWKAGVQVMVEGPGHVPLDQIITNIKLEKSVCRGAPFYVLGPLVTDIGAGYDHITGAIGGAIAAAAGADFLCYVTPSEHVSLPEPEDVKQGVIASRIAAHAADIVKGIKGALDWDLQMSLARKKLDWDTQEKLSLDPQRFRCLHSRFLGNGSTCSMCGEYCAMDMVEKYLGISAIRC
ncbi:phosphomethylpyrimidine synthase ThiC [Chloroflexota bacterium]